MHLNLVHLLFLHGLAATIYVSDKKKMDASFRLFVHDICLIMETYIDRVDDPQLKEKMKYKPIPDDEEIEDKKPE